MNDDDTEIEWTIVNILLHNANSSFPNLSQEVKGQQI